MISIKTLWIYRLEQLYNIFFKIDFIFNKFNKTIRMFKKIFCLVLFIAFVFSKPNITNGKHFIERTCIGKACNIDLTEEDCSDTLVLKDTNILLKFEDTSDSDYPNNDWAIKINSLTQHGDNYFKIQDLTGGTDPLRIEAGAPDNSLFISPTGAIGFGTNTSTSDFAVDTLFGGFEFLSVPGPKSALRVAGKNTDEAEFTLLSDNIASRLRFAGLDTLTRSEILFLNDEIFFYGPLSNPLVRFHRVTTTFWSPVALSAFGIGVNPGTDVCFGAGNILCACGTCP